MCAFLPAKPRVSFNSCLLCAFCSAVSPVLLYNYACAWHLVYVYLALLKGVRHFLKHYRLSKTISRRPGSGLPPKLSPALQRIIEEEMAKDDETTATQLQAILASKNVYVSLATIVRNRLDLGWTYRGTAYCQLIRQPNKQKRLDWARTYLGDKFEDVIWTDETSVQIETLKHFCYRKKAT